MGPLGTVTEKLIKGLEDLEITGQGKLFQTTALLRSARILKTDWRLEETCCHPNFCERRISNRSGDNNNNNNNNNNNTGKHGNKKKSGDRSNSTIIKIGQNTGKCPGDFKTLAVTQTRKMIYQ